MKSFLDLVEHQDGVAFVEPAAERTVEGVLAAMKAFASQDREAGRVHRHDEGEDEILLLRPADTVPLLRARRAEAVAPAFSAIGLLDSTSPLRRTSAAAAKRCHNGCEPVCVSSAAAG